MEGRQAETTVAQQLFMRCLAPVEGMQQAEFGYDVDDPFSVTVTLADAGGESWELARTVLVQGITGVAGAGHARVWPIVNDAGRSLVVLHLESPQGELVAEVLTTQLDRFLGRTTALVPLGTESERLDLDALVEQLLTSEPG
ncbi:hypothetical protein GCM10009623_01410 [Nocardioides aestuarii]|uniref:SsgA family sporulation/cell division regulator n=1 Tax=Nocardioides aestuarii TaxID=252231 RepID=A0ABW4TH04_9ACTN